MLVLPTPSEPVSWLPGQDQARAWPADRARLNNTEPVTMQPDPGLLGPVGFDLDMTLIDARPAVMAAFGALARELRVEIDLNEVDRRFRIKLEDELAHWFPPADIASSAEVFRRHYVALAPQRTKTMPGAQAALAAVRAAGSTSAIITAKHEVSVEPCLAATGLQADQVFAYVHGPEKAAVLEQIQALIYVGDTPADMVAARDADVVALGVATGSLGSASLAEAGASAVLATLELFPAWYVEFCGSRFRGSPSSL